MKRLFALLALMVLIMGAIPALAATPLRDKIRGTATALDDDSDDTGDGEGEGSVDETALQKCIRVMDANTGVKDPEKVCQDIVSRRKACVNVLTASGVERPAVACAKLGLAVAANVQVRNEDRKEALTRIRTEVRMKIGQDVRTMVAEHRLDRIARFAESHPNITGFVTGLPPEKQEIFLHMGREKQLKLMQMDTDDADDELGRFKLKVVKKAVLFKHRAVAKDKIERATLKFKEARDIYQEAKEDLREARKAFEEAKRSGDDAATMEAAKEYLTLAADIEIAALEKIRSRVEANEDLTDEEAQAILDEIDEKIAELEAAKVQVEAAQTKEEVKEAAKSILDIGRRLKVRFAVHVMKLKERQVGAITERSAHLEERFDCALAALDNAGADTTEIEALMSDFSAKVESAREKHSQSEALLEEAKELRAANTTDRDLITQKVKDSRDLLQDAQSDLREAHAILKDILAEVRAAGAGLGACGERDADVDADEDVVVEEVEDDSDDDEEETDDDLSEDADDDDASEAISDDNDADDADEDAGESADDDADDSGDDTLSGINDTSTDTGSEDDLGLNETATGVNETSQ